MNRVVIALLLALVAFCEPVHAGEKRPNIVLILSDDLGWTDVACYGKKYHETPNIDRLARQGLRFTSAYTCGPNCQPTRATLISGQYGPRTGVYTVGTSERGEAALRKLVPVVNRTTLPLECHTVAESLKDAGYATAIYGKWHLGEAGELHPSRRGFDEAITSMGKHFDFKTQPPTKYPQGIYLADYLTDLSVTFIEKQKDRPFFLFLSHFAVHSPLDGKKELVEKYTKKFAGGGAPPDAKPVYAAMLESVDQSVGRVLAKLEELGLLDNTIVLFSSDNGGVGYNTNLPLRGGKGMLYEGGVRVPLVVRWPGKTPVGKTTDEPTVTVDFYPTFLELAGGKAKVGYPLDGVSLVPVFKDAQHHIRRDLFWHFPCYLEDGKKGGAGFRTTPASSIRSENLKLIEFFETGKLELYDLAADLGQKNDLAAQRPDDVRELHRRLVAWRQSLNAALPTPKAK